MFTPDPAAALAEIHRVLSPGGRLGALTWGGLEHNPWMTCVGLAAMANGIVAGGPPIGPGGIFSLADPAELERLTAAAGFADATVTAVPVTFTAESIDAHLDRVAALAGPLAARARGSLTRSARRLPRHSDGACHALPHRHRRRDPGPRAPRHGPTAGTVGATAVAPPRPDPGVHGVCIPPVGGTCEGWTARGPSFSSTSTAPSSTPTTSTSRRGRALSGPAVT